MKMFWKRTFSIVTELTSSRWGKHPKPPASEVLTTYLRQRKLPPWTSYFIPYTMIRNNQFGLSHFNWNVDGTNYHILRTGCFPFIKYHCSKRPWQDLSIENRFFTLIKGINVGIPCLMYGIAAMVLISHRDHVIMNSYDLNVPVYFWYKETEGAIY